MTNVLTTTCCIAGGGPAGMMLGLLLARAGVPVVVLEKHADFFRDFRGDTIHPSTLEVMYELGILDEFLRLPHDEVRALGGNVWGNDVQIADLTHLPTHCKFLVFMPQWDFLNFLASKASAYPHFSLQMNAGVTDLIVEDGRVRGVRAQTPDGELEIRADLTIGADGRHSTVREKAALNVVDFGAPMDVLWMRISRHEGDVRSILGRVDAGRIMVMLDRTTYWQCGYIIAKGKFGELRARGLAAFRNDILTLAPFLGDRVNELQSWDDVKLLTVVVDRLERWHRPGLLCIGDAAHAMSPVGGVGINLAIQDAVATANILAAPLRAHSITDDDLERVQQRRLFPTKVTQAMQIFIQRRIITGVLGATSLDSRPLPWPMKLFQRFPVLRRLPAYAVGVGVRPEHVRYDTI